MPNKRDVLSHLHRDELVAALDTFGLTVADRRVKADLVEALGASRTASLEAILSGYKRDRLKELCRALGLDDSGKVIADIVARVTGTPSRGRATAQLEVAFAAAENRAS